MSQLSDKYRTAVINYNAAKGSRQALWSLQDEADALGGQSKRLIRLQDEQWEVFKEYERKIKEEKRRIAEAMNPDCHEKADDNVRHWRRELNKLEKHARLFGQLETVVERLDSDDLSQWREQLALTAILEDGETIWEYE